MKSELYFLAKTALVLTFVDAFIPRVEIYGKNHAKIKHNHEYEARPKTAYNHLHLPHYPHHDYPHTTEINTELFDLNPVHGGDNGVSKHGIDGKLIQRASLRQHRDSINDKSHTEKLKNKEVEPNIVENLNANTFQKVIPENHSAEHEHKKPLTDIYFGLKHYHRD